MDLNETLRAAVAEPPPTSIDLDVLIKHERRRERQQRWLSGGAIAAGIAATIGVTAVGFGGTLPVPFAGGGAPPCPKVSPNPMDLKKSLDPSAETRKSPVAGATESPKGTDAPGRGTGSGKGTDVPIPAASASYGSVTEKPVPASAGPVPSESCGSAARRLNAALSDALHRVAPSAKLTNADDAHRTAVWFQQYGDGQFIADVVVRDGDREGGLFVGVSTYGEVPTRDQICLKVPEGDCSYETKADGTIVVRLTFEQVVLSTVDGKVVKDPNSRLGALGYSFQVYRPDGTLVSAALKPWAAQVLKGDPVPAGSATAKATPPDAPNLQMEPALTADQVSAIALTPGLTLFP